MAYIVLDYLTFACLRLSLLAVLFGGPLAVTNFRPLWLVVAAVWAVLFVVSLKYVQWRGDEWRGI